MFPRGGGQSTLTPEVPRRKHRKGLSSSGHDLNRLGQQKYDRDALAFNHYIGYINQPLRRHLSSDITYLVPSMPIQSNPSANQQLVSYDVNQPTPPLPSSSSTTTTTTTTQYDGPTRLAKSPEPIYSAPRRQRSFRKQRSLEYPTNDNQSKQSTNSSNLGPTEMKPSTSTSINPIGYLSAASTSVPHLPQQQSPSSQLVQQRPLDYPVKPNSVSTEGLIQHIISQQSQIERLSKQQDFLTQQLLISREVGSSSETSANKRGGRSRTRSTSSSSKGHHHHHQQSDSLSSLGGSTGVGGGGGSSVKRRSSSREKIQEQLHAQQARVQQHIQQLEAQLELIRDIRTSSRPTSRSHSRAPSMRDGSSCPPEDEESIDQHHLKRPKSADPKWLKSNVKLPLSSSSQLEDDESKQLKSNVNPVLLPPPIGTINPAILVDQGTINSSSVEQSISKPRLILTNPSEESKDDEETIKSDEANVNQNKSPLIVNRPTLIDQDDGIPFMDDELIDDGPDGNDSDELETVFEFDRSDNDGNKLDSQDGQEEEIDDDDEEEDYEDWEDDEELDYYSRDVGSPQAETDPWSRLMEEDILKAREEMDRQRSLMDRQELDLSDQRRQLLDTEDTINFPPRQLNSNNQVIDQPVKQISNENYQTLTANNSGQMRFSPQMVNQQIDQSINQTLIPLAQYRSRSSSPTVSNQRQQQLTSGVNYQQNQQNQLAFNQGNIFNFNEMDTKQFQSQLTSANMINQQRLSPNQINLPQSSNLTNLQQRLSPNPLVNQQIATSASSSFSPVINNRSNRGANEGTIGGGVGIGIAPPRVIDRQISTPVSNANNQIKSPNSNYIKRPSFEDQPSELFIQSSILRSKMLIPSSMNLTSINQFNQPSVPPRRKPVTPRSRSPIQGTSSSSGVTSPSFRIQTNKNRMAGQQFISSPRRPQRSTSQTDQQLTYNNQKSNQHQQLNQRQSYEQQQFVDSSLIRSNNLLSTVNQQSNQQQQRGQQFNQQPFTSSLGTNNLVGQLTPRLYSPKPTTARTTPSTTTINRPESMFRPITSKQLKVNPIGPPVIKIDPARSISNLNLSSQSPISFNQSRRSPSPQPQPQSHHQHHQHQHQSTSSPSPTPSSSASSFLKRAGSFIQRNTTFMNKHQSKNSNSHSNNQIKNQQQQQLKGSPSPLPITSPPNITVSSSLLSPITNLFSSSNQSGNTLKVDLQSIRSNRSSRASSPVPPPRPTPQENPPTRKIFINKDTVEAGSFKDHFNHYYAPQSEPNRRPLSQQFTHSSTGELNILGRSITPMRDFGNHHGKQSMDNQQPLKRTPSNSSNHHKPGNQSTANALIDAPIHYERRQTLPEITKGLGVEDKISAKEEAVLRNLAGKKKHSLPQDDLHEIPLIPGWEREKVATLAHEAREARMNQPTGPVVHLTAVTNWLIKYKFIGLIIFFNAILMYLFMRILQPINGQMSESDDQSRPK